MSLRQRHSCHCRRTSRNVCCASFFHPTFQISEQEERLCARKLRGSHSVSLNWDVCLEILIYDEAEEFRCGSIEKVCFLFPALM